MTYSILGTGLVGSALHKQFPNSQIYNRTNCEKLTHRKHATLIIAAPTGNRPVVSETPLKDLRDCYNIIELVRQCNYDNLVHISTVDVYPEKISNNAEPVLSPKELGYGHNRWFFDHALSQLPRCHVIRLPSLVDKSVNKNILYDLKNKCWLHKLSLDSMIQWYPLKNLAKDIAAAVDQKQKYQNLSTAPVSNRRIVQVFFPELLEQLEQNKVVPVSYNIKNYNQLYHVSDAEIWQCFEEYFY
jgi:hypothetical protein